MNRMQAVQLPKVPGGLRELLDRIELGTDVRGIVQCKDGSKS